MEAIGVIVWCIVAIVAMLTRRLWLRRMLAFVLVLGAGAAGVAYMTAQTGDVGLALACVTVPVYFMLVIGLYMRDWGAAIRNENRRSTPE